jgi:uroporphyrinogen-III synthase
MKDSIQILSTASLNEDLLQRLRTGNWHVKMASFIRIVTDVTKPLRERIGGLQAQPATVIFTSANAVHPIGKLLQGNANLTIYCIGGATRDAVTEYFGGSSIQDVGDNAADLVKKIMLARPASVVFFCGSERMDTIPQRLVANGIAVEEIEVYRTELQPQPMEEHFDAILFFSPSGVRSFFSSNTIAASATCFAIGPTTAAEIEVYTKNKIIIAGQPGKKEVIDAVINFYDGHD